MIDDAGSDQHRKTDFCPYVGLAPFDHAHWDYYFGRELDASTLADNALYALATVLYGPSGIGKSSLINIGLPKELAKRRRGADVVVFRRWQRRNLPTALMAQISRTLRLPSKVLHEAPRRRVSDFVRFVVTHRSRPLVIVFDQFEEYFVYRPSERDFLLEAELDQIIHEDALDVQLLFAIREDRYHLLDSLRLTIPAILDNTLELGHLNEEAVRAAIVKPLEVYNAQYRQGRDPIPPPGFVDRLISELRQVETGGGRADAVAPTERRIELPYLQLALEKIWKAAGGAGMRGLTTATPLRSASAIF